MWKFCSKIWSVGKTFSKVWQVLNFFLRNLIFVFFQILTDWWSLLSTLLSTYFREEYWKSMRVKDLVASCTTDRCHTSIRLSISQEKHHDNKQFSQELRTELSGAQNVADKQCLSEYTFVKTNGSALQLEFHAFSPMSLFEQQEEERWKAAETYTASTRYWLPDITYHTILTLI